MTEKGYCTDSATGCLDLTNSLLIQDLATPSIPRSALGQITAALKLRFERQLPPVTILLCDNVRENGHVVREAVLALARLQDSILEQLIEDNVTFPCIMVDRIVPAVTTEILTEILTEIAQLLGVVDSCAIACESFRQQVIEDNFVNRRPDQELVGAQFVADVVRFEMMKLRMLNGSHSFLAYLGYLVGCAHISDTMTNADYRKAAIALMLNEQAPTLINRGVTMTNVPLTGSKLAWMNIALGNIYASFGFNNNCQRCHTDDCG